MRSVRAERIPPELGPADLLADYTLRAPAGSSGVPPVHSPILYVAPFDERNRRVLGVDMMLEPQRREVMSRAMATGEAAVSPRLQLSGSLDDEPGFIVYVPIQREGSFLGWLTAAFLAETFTAGVDEARGTEVDFEIFDGVTSGAEGLLYSSAGTAVDGSPLRVESRDAPFTSTSLVDVPSATWRVQYVAPDDFVSWPSRAVPWAVLLLGLLTTAAFVTVSQAGERWRGQALTLEEQTEVLSRARQEAEVATRAKSAFLATMSHEIRTPLNAVLGLNRVLLETPLDADQRGYVELVDESGRHLLHVINEILDFSKIEAGRVDLERERFDLPDCVRSVVSLMAPGARTAAVSLEARVDTDQWVWGDVSRLRQVLLNLVANALTFTPAGGRVVVRAQRVGEGTVAFAVEDSGIGMSAEQTERIFEAFVQAETSTSREYGGTGLGLSIAQRIVTAMGGTLAVSSVPGRGSTFSFTVPAEPAEPAEPPARAATATAANGAGPALTPLGRRHPLRVLVAEDDDVNQVVVERMLLSLGYRADLVGDGAEALDAVRSQDYDVVLLDLQMPVMDGRAAAAEIVRLRGAAEHPRLVAMTGRGSDHDREQAVLAGFEDLVLKPFDPDDLARALGRATPRPGPLPDALPGGG